MARFVKLEYWYSELPIWVNPDQVVSVIANAFDSRASILTMSCKIVDEDNTYQITVKGDPQNIVSQLGGELGD